MGNESLTTYFMYVMRNITRQQWFAIRWMQLVQTCSNFLLLESMNPRVTILLLRRLEAIW